MGFTYSEAYNIAIWQREWFLERINKEITKSAEANDGQGAASRAAHQNDPQTRSLLGRNRSQVPARLRRST